MPDGRREAVATLEPGRRVNVRAQQVASKAIRIHPGQFADWRRDLNRGLAHTRQDASENRSAEGWSG
jgi:hypothetical protein